MLTMYAILKLAGTGIQQPGTRRQCGQCLGEPGLTVSLVDVFEHGLFPFRLESCVSVLTQQVTHHAAVTECNTQFSQTIEKPHTR